MDAKNCVLSVQNNLKPGCTLLSDGFTMGLPSPYVHSQFHQDFITQVCVQARGEHEKAFQSPTASYCDVQSRSSFKYQRLCATDFEKMIAAMDLPEELTSQFSPRQCGLCAVKMNSAIQSRMHYHGKQHQKKVKFFMYNWRKEHGGSYSKKIGKNHEVNCLKTPEDKRLYCKCCDLSFTSALHAQQHYRGRNHQRVSIGLQPLKSGYFNNTTGKWQRFPPPEEQDYGVIPSPYEPMVSCDSPSSESMIHNSVLPFEKRVDQEIKRSRFFCELCNIGVTSQEQLEMHIKGGKHKKAKRAFQNSDMWVEDSDNEDDAVKVPPADSILASVTKEGKNPKKSKLKDFSIYRTPSGKFYCQLCNMTVESEAQFIQHLDSKMHRITSGPKKSSAPGVSH